MEIYKVEEHLKNIRFRLINPNACHSCYMPLQIQGGILAEAVNVVKNSMQAVGKKIEEGALSAHFSNDPERGFDVCVELRLI